MTTDHISLINLRHEPDHSCSIFSAADQCLYNCISCFLCFYLCPSQVFPSQALYSLAGYANPRQASCVHDPTIIGHAWQAFCVHDTTIIDHDHCVSAISLYSIGCFLSGMSCRTMRCADMASFDALLPRRSTGLHTIVVAMSCHNVFFIGT